MLQLFMKIKKNATHRIRFFASARSNMEIRRLEAIENTNKAKQATKSAIDIISQVIFIVLSQCSDSV